MFIGLVNVIVALGSLVAIGFGIYHHLTIYDPFVLVSSIIYVLVVVGTRWLHPNRRVTAILQLCLVINMILNGMGTASLYRTSYHYDDLVHFISPAMLTYVGAMWLALKHKPVWPAIVFAAVISLGWEPVEIFFDAVFGTQTVGQWNQPLDTRYDLIVDTLGIVVAAIVFFKTKVRLLRWLQHQ
jgi:uncharacterized membrane protein YjdF